MKSIFSSLTMRGVMLTLVSYALTFLSPALDRQEMQGVIDGVLQLWPELLGITTALGAAVHRLQAWNFDKTMLRSKTFWAGVVGAAIALMNAFQMPTEGLQDLADHIFAALAKAGPLIGSILIIIGRVRAKQPLQIRRAVPVQDDGE